MNTQFKKGALDLCVLTLLKKHDAYGYELADKISSQIQIAEGTLYPLLRKLKADGLCETYLSEDSAGPPRKYYRLTIKGINEQKDMEKQWISFVQSVSNIMKEKSEEEEK